MDTTRFLRDSLAVLFSAERPVGYGELTESYSQRLLDGIELIDDANKTVWICAVEKYMQAASSKFEERAQSILLKGLEAYKRKLGISDERPQQDIDLKALLEGRIATGTFSGMLREQIGQVSGRPGMLASLMADSKPLLWAAGATLPETEEEVPPVSRRLEMSDIQSEALSLAFVAEDIARNMKKVFEGVVVPQIDDPHDPAKPKLERLEKMLFATAKTLNKRIPDAGAFSDSNEWFLALARFVNKAGVDQDPIFQIVGACLPYLPNIFSAALGHDHMALARYRREIARALARDFESRFYQGSGDFLRAALRASRAAHETKVCVQKIVYAEQITVEQGRRLIKFYGEVIDRASWLCNVLLGNVRTQGNHTDNANRGDIYRLQESLWFIAQGRQSLAEKFSQVTASAPAPAAQEDEPVPESIAGAALSDAQAAAVVAQEAQYQQVYQQPAAGEGEAVFLLQKPIASSGGSGIKP